MDPETEEPEHPGDVYGYIDDAFEFIGRYHPQGYHPVRLGDEYSDDRYCIIHKLGCGGYSTVWLARDRQQKRYAALKIILADETARTSESRSLRHLQHNKFPSTTGSKYISNLLDEFHIEGPNGRHPCLALEPAGGSVAESKEEAIHHMFPLEISRAVTAQAVLGVQAIHSRGIVHGGRSQNLSSPAPRAI